MINLAVLIPTHNRCQSLKRLIQCIYDQDISNIETKIVVIVDGSTDGSIEMLTNDYPDVISITGDGTWWYTRSINEGYSNIKHEKPDFVLTLNDDIILPKNYIKAILDSAGEIKKTAIIGSVSLTINPPHKIIFSGIKRINKLIDRSTAYIPYLQMYHDQFRNQNLPSVVLPGRGLLIPFKAMEELKGFDERFMQYQSDYDFCLRAAEAGVYSFVSYRAIVYCNEKLTSSSSTTLNPGLKQIIQSLFIKSSRYYLLNRSLYYWKHYYRILWPLYMIKYIVSIMLRSKLFKM